ncbi:hypothetical protein ACFE04_003832 [Oxalis oulophora]
MDDYGGEQVQLQFDEDSYEKLFIGGVSWETTQETFANYFGKYGEISDSVIMMDKYSGRPRGFGFVTFADPAVADKVLKQEHNIDGRTVEVKMTVPREDMDVNKGVTRTKKIFIGGIPPSLTDDELKEYFSPYGSIVEHQIMLDHKTGRSRGFGFVTFDTEDAVEQVFSEGRTHELAGKEVEIKRAVPKRAGGDFGGSTRPYSGGFAKGRGGYAGDLGSGHASSGGGGGAYGFGGRVGGKMARGFGNSGMYGGGFGAGAGAGAGSYGSYNGGYGGNYGGGAAGFYGGGYGGYGYGFGFGGPTMYGGGGGGGYGGSGYGGAGGGGYGSSTGAGGYSGGAAGYGGGGKGYGSGGGGYGGSRGYGGGGGGSDDGSYGGGREYGSNIDGGYGGGSYGSGYGGNGRAGYDNGGGDSSYGSGKGYGNGAAGGGGRFHPYRK